MRATLAIGDEVAYDEEFETTETSFVLEGEDLVIELGLEDATKGPSHRLVLQINDRSGEPALKLEIPIYTEL